MKYKYITIEREYGSGGTKIAKLAADKCGIPCYGREILEIVAEKQHIAIEDIERYEESATNSLLYTLYVLGKTQGGEHNVLTREGRVFLAEQTVISRLAAEGSAIFVGRCASDAIKDRQGKMLRVFIKSNSEDKTKRIINDYHIPEDQVASVMRRYDKRRANYFGANTGRKWTDPENYDLILDSGKLGIAGCAAAITGVYQA